MVYGGVVEQAQDIVHNAALPDTPRSTQALQDGNAYALVAILLSQRHNLQSVQLDYSFIWQGAFPRLMLKHALFAPGNSLYPSLISLPWQTMEAMPRDLNI